MAGGTNKLSDASLRKMIGRESPGDNFYADGDGLSVKVTKSGVMTWFFAYRLGGREAKPQRLKLGNYPDMSLKLAREKREQCRVWLASSKDPKHQLKLMAAASLKPVTVKDALQYWITQYAEDNRANVERHKAQLEKHIYPYIGAMPLAQCETRYWLECFDRAKKNAPVAAGYVFQMCKQALKFCRVRRYAISNALDDLTIPDVGRKQDKGDRDHSDDEIGQIWQACQQLKFKPYYTAMLRLLVVFGCRSQEVRLSTWAEWDLKNWVWTVPKEHSKAGIKILRPVPAEMRPFIEWLYNQHKDSGLLLGELKQSSAVSAWGRLVWKRLGHEEPWTLHDIRRTFATKLNDLGIAPHVVEQLLGHTMPGVMAIYNLSQYMPEKLMALNLWCERLEKISYEHLNVTIFKVSK
ncbi:TPA: site-specific integrase [Serratia marcescens]|uniref:tyrosine-type recombinase/integrase n=1 Tax=Serratia TaxID=613 RepID=UPI00217AC972|nr:site-specific integrase [Serratia marcescens]BEO53738.1 integrase [Serratia marcescens]CAI1728552.1 Putative prophage CPS-53 integrase [Serratia marcescens]HCD7748921.1 site-specific integrase [Serratia marcescens]